jgi:hypothetical protein
MKSGMTFDSRQFIKGVETAVKTIDETSEKSAVETGYAIIKDCAKFLPTTPKDKGDLRASGKVERPKLSGNKIEIEFGFNMPYAARIHEAPESWNWTEPGSGPKYLEKTLLNSPGADHYIQMIALAIKLRGGG